MASLVERSLLALEFRDSQREQLSCFQLFPPREVVPRNQLPSADGLPRYAGGKDFGQERRTKTPVRMVDVHVDEYRGSSRRLSQGVERRFERSGLP